MTLSYRLLRDFNEPIPGGGDPRFRGPMPERTDEEGDLRGRIVVRRLEDIDVIVRPKHRVTADPLDLGAMLVDPVGDLAFEFLDEFRLGDGFGGKTGKEDVSRHLRLL